MYLSLISFFISLAGIIFMLGRKLIMLRNGQIVLGPEQAMFGRENLEKVKRATLEGLKKYSHMALVMILRFYIKTSNFLKNQYQEIKTRIENHDGR